MYGGFQGGEGSREAQVLEGFKVGRETTDLSGHHFSMPFPFSDSFGSNTSKSYHSLGTFSGPDSWMAASHFLCGFSSTVIDHPATHNATILQARNLSFMEEWGPACSPTAIATANLPRTFTVRQAGPTDEEMY